VNPAEPRGCLACPPRRLVYSASGAAALALSAAALAALPAIWLAARPAPLEPLPAD
jgi:hypothetical protein